MSGFERCVGCDPDNDCSVRQRCFSEVALSLRYSDTCTPTRTPSKTPPRRPNNSYERGILRDDRGLPITDKGHPIPLKTYHNHKRHFDEMIRRSKQGVRDSSPTLSN